jgi:hypothetical protein
MRSPTLVLIALSLVARGASGQASQPHVPRIAPSSFATVAVHVSARRLGNNWDSDVFMGPARVAITYGQPHARGRTVVGRLIPQDTVWRLGANLATTLENDLDIELGGLRIPRGRYSLYTLYTNEGWQLIVSRAAGQIGAYDYTSANDLGRITLAARTLAEPEESLSIYLIPDARPGGNDPSLSGTLRIKWGTIDLRAPWRIAEGVTP